MGEPYSLSPEDDARIQAQTVTDLQRAGDRVDGQEPGKEMTTQRLIADAARMVSQGTMTQEDYYKLISENS